MSKRGTSSPDRKRMLAALAALPGVHRALPDDTGDRVFLICETSDQEDETLAAVQRLIRESGPAADGLEVRLAHLGGKSFSSRVRFVDVEMKNVGMGVARARVDLEWAGERYAGEAEGEASPAGEIRACANATARALEQVSSGGARFTLIGVKAIRIFDTDLVTVLLQSPAGEGRSLIGAYLVNESLHRAAVLAVLNATNRTLGNFLPTSH